MSYKMPENRIEERVYSVTMTEEELRLFSEFLSERSYSRKKKYMTYTGKLPKYTRDGVKISGNQDTWGFNGNNDMDFIISRAKELVDNGTLTTRRSYDNFLKSECEKYIKDPESLAGYVRETIRHKDYYGRNLP